MSLPLSLDVHNHFGAAAILAQMVGYRNGREENEPQHSGPARLTVMMKALVPRKIKFNCRDNR